MQCFPNRLWLQAAVDRGAGKGDIITRTSHYESFTMSGMGYNVTAAWAKGCTAWRRAARLDQGLDHIVALHHRSPTLYLNS